MTRASTLRRALVVDDNRDLADNIAEILECEGFETLVESDPLAAMARAEGFAFDVAILDVRMPGMDGVTLLALLLRLRPDAIFVMVTGFTHDERIQHALAGGARAVLPKPVAVPRLLEIVTAPP